MKTNADILYGGFERFGNFYIIGKTQMKYIFVDEILTFGSPKNSCRNFIIVRDFSLKRRCRFFGRNALYRLLVGISSELQSLSFREVTHRPLRTTGNKN